MLQFLPQQVRICMATPVRFPAVLSRPELHLSIFRLIITQRLTSETVSTLARPAVLSAVSRCQPIQPLVHMQIPLLYLQELVPSPQTLPLLILIRTLMLISATQISMSLAASVLQPQQRQKQSLKHLVSAPVAWQLVHHLLLLK